MSEEVKNIIGIAIAIAIVVTVVAAFITWNNNMMVACEDSGGEVLTGILDVYRKCQR